MKKKLFIIFPITIILAFLLYKTCLLLYFKDLNSYTVGYSNFKIDTKKIVTDKELSNAKINDMNIYIPNGLKKVMSKYSNDNTYYIPVNEELDDYSNMVLIGKSINCFEGIYREDKRLQTMNINKLMKKNNINTEFDLVKYYYNEKTKNSIFTSKNDIKMNYLADICVKNSVLNSISDDNYYLEGDILGMATFGKKGVTMKVHNKNKNEYYYISIIKQPKKENYKEIFTESEIDKIISSIYFG